MALPHSQNPQNLREHKKFISVLSGGFTANYLTPLVGHWIGLGDSVLYGLAFLLGFGGLKGVETAFAMFVDRASARNQNS